MGLSSGQKAAHWIVLAVALTVTILSLLGWLPSGSRYGGTRPAGPWGGICFSSFGVLIVIVIVRILWRDRMFAHSHDAHQLYHVAIDPHRSWMCVLKGRGPALVTCGVQLSTPTVGDMQPVLLRIHALSQAARTLSLQFSTATLYRELPAITISHLRDWSLTLEFSTEERSCLLEVNLAARGQLAPVSLPQPEEVIA